MTVLCILYKSTDICKSALKPKAKNVISKNVLRVD